MFQPDLQFIYRAFHKISARDAMLAFLAPPIVDAIADGRQPPDLTMERLTRRTVLPLDWDAQKRLLASDSARG